MPDISTQPEQAAQRQTPTDPSEPVSDTKAQDQGATTNAPGESNAFGVVSVNSSSQFPSCIHLLGTIKWPVPQIMVSFRGLQFAYDREGIAQLGRLVCPIDPLCSVSQAKSQIQGFKKKLFATMLWKPPWSNCSQREMDIAYERSTFAKTVLLLGVFYAVHGKDDVGPVPLGNIGWAGMVENLVSITVDFEDEPGKRPKAGVTDGH